MVMKRFGNRKFHAANEKAEEGLGFFLLGLGGKGEISLFFLMFPSVLIKFPKYSYQASKVFPKLLMCSLICSQNHFMFYPILFGHGSTSMCINCKGGPKGSMTKHAFILGGGKNI